MTRYETGAYAQTHTLEVMQTTKMLFVLSCRSYIFLANMIVNL